MRSYPDGDTNRLVALATLYLRAPASWYLEDGAPVVVFDPPLSGAEQAIYDRLPRIARSLITGITPAEWEALEPDIAGLVTYQGLPSPNLAQTVMAVRAQSRILRALLRD